MPYIEILETDTKVIFLKDLCGGYHTVPMCIQDSKKAWHTAHSDFRYIHVFLSSKLCESPEKNDEEIFLFVDVVSQCVT